MVHSRPIQSIKNRYLKDIIVVIIIIIVVVIIIQLKYQRIYQRTPSAHSGSLEILTTGAVMVNRNAVSYSDLQLRV
jgi:uncharacterized protein YpmB